MEFIKKLAIILTLIKVILNESLDDLNYDETIKFMDKVISDLQYETFSFDYIKYQQELHKKILLENQQLSHNHTILGKIYLAEGLCNLFGKNDQQQVNYQLSAFYLKLSGMKYGNSIAQFHYSILVSLQLDGNYQLKRNIVQMVIDGNLVDNLSREQTNTLMNFIKRRQNQKTHLLLYTSAMQNNAQSQTTLGYKYFRGIQLNEDCPTASLFYLQAVRNFYKDKVKTYSTNKYLATGNLPFDQNTLEIHKDLIYKSFTKNFQVEQKEQLLFLQMDADNSADSNFMLGFYHQFGQMGLAQSYEKALQFYQRAHEIGSQFSTYMVANFNLMGYGTPKNSKVALDLFKTLAQGNFSHALNGLGYMYQSGIGVARNKTLAISYYK